MHFGNCNHQKLSDCVLLFQLYIDTPALFCMIYLACAFPGIPDHWWVRFSVTFL